MRTDEFDRGYLLKTIKKLKTAKRRVHDVELSFKVAGEPPVERGEDLFTERLNIVCDLIRQEIKYVEGLVSV